MQSCYLLQSFSSSESFGRQVGQEESEVNPLGNWRWCKRCFDDSSCSCWSRNLRGRRTSSRKISRRRHFSIPISSKVTSSPRILVIRSSLKDDSLFFLQEHHSLHDSILVLLPIFFLWSSSFRILDSFLLQRSFHRSPSFGHRNFRSISFC